MKSLALILALATAPFGIGVAAPALAQTETVAPRLTVDTPIETILADPAGKAVLIANMPGIDTHPMLDMIKTMSLRQIQPYSEGKITDEMLAKLTKELGAIK